MQLSTSDSLPGTAPEFPAWSTALFVACLVIMVVTTAGIARAHSRQAKRRIYWIGWLSTALCAASSLLPLGTRTAVLVFAGFAFAIIFWAWLTTPYLQIGGRIFALTMADSRPDPNSDTPEDAEPLDPPQDSYPGPVSAGTVWWIFAILTVASSVGIFVGGWIWQTISVTVLLTFLAVVCGVDDASRNLPVARGQYPQAVVIAVAAIMLWLTPVIGYATGYLAGKFKPAPRRP